MKIIINLPYFQNLDLVEALWNIRLKCYLQFSFENFSYTNVYILFRFFLMLRIFRKFTVQERTMELRRIKHGVFH